MDDANNPDTPAKPSAWRTYSIYVGAFSVGVCWWLLGVLTAILIGAGLGLSLDNRPTPVWLAYSAVVFLYFAWPLLGLVITRGYSNLNRALKLVVLVSAGVSLLLGVGTLLGDAFPPVRIIDAHDVVYFRAAISGGIAWALAGTASLAAVAVAGWPNKRIEPTARGSIDQ